MQDYIKDECILRMQMLDLEPSCIKDFEKEKVYISENNGELRLLKNEEKTIVEEIENNYDIKVYHIMHDFYEFGECYTMLCVSKEQSEWEQDHLDIRANCPFAYVYNVSDTNCSEFGSIGIERKYGRIIRTY